MALCKTCLFYSRGNDDLNREFNDIGKPDNHYCPMFQDAMPDGVFEGEKDCDYYEPKEGGETE